MLFFLFVVVLFCFVLLLFFHVSNVKQKKAFKKPEVELGALTEVRNSKKSGGTTQCTR